MVQCAARGLLLGIGAETTRTRPIAKPGASCGVESLDGRRPPSARTHVHYPRIGGHPMRHHHPRHLTARLAALLLLAGLAAPALAERKVVVGDESKTFAVEGARRLKLDVPVGEVHVQAGGGDHIEA